MSRLICMALLPALLATPALAQTPDPHAGHAMPAAKAATPPTADPHAGHAMPAPKADPHAGHAAPVGAPAADPHAGHAAPAQPADPHAGHGAAPSVTPTGADLPVGTEPPPPPPAEPGADGVYGAAPMAEGRAILRQEHGGTQLSKVMANMSEARLGSGGGYHWDLEA